MVHAGLDPDIAPWGGGGGGTNFGEGSKGPVGRGQIPGRGFRGLKPPTPEAKRFSAFKMALESSPLTCFLHSFSSLE